jgi:Protein of unknown function (DUF3892)
MVDSVRIRCTTKIDRRSAHERIERVGGVNPDGRRWELSEAEAIQGIKDYQWAFYVHQGAGPRVDVIVATRLGSEYLTTKADGEQPDNLLALPECP